MTPYVLDRPGESTGLDPIEVGRDASAATTGRRSFRAPRIALDWSSAPLATVTLLLLGAALGPHGLSLLTPQILAFFDTAAPVAMAGLGVIAGLSLRVGTANGRTVVAASVQAMVTAIVVAGGVLVAGPPLTTANFFSPWWMGALVLGIAAATSSSLSADRLTGSSEGDFIGLHDHDHLVPIVIGAGLLAWLREPSPAAALSLAAQAAAVAAVIAAAGWMLVSRALTKAEERLFAFASLLLLGGVADYLSVSALFGGLVAGACWLLASGAVRESIRRDVVYVQHSLLVLILLLAGARADFSPAALTLSIAYVVFRTGGKMAGGSLARRLVPALLPDTTLQLISPGVFGIAFALNVVRVAGPESAPVLTVAVVGTIASSVIAVAARTKVSKP